MQRSTSAFALLASTLVYSLAACVASTPDSPAPRTTPSGGANNASSGGAVASGGSSGGYISAGTGGSVANSGGAGGIATGGTAGSPQAGGTAGSSAGTGNTEPVDCSGIVAAGHELCASSATTCEAVFTNGAGCTAVCAAAGLACASGAENTDGACAADLNLPAVSCDSGHLSDYCRCEGAAAGTGGAPGAGGAPGSGGTSGAGGSGGSAGASTGTPDCNSVTSEPIITVAKSGSPNFQTVQAAIDSLSTGNTTPTQIRIAPGNYQEKLRIDRPYITLCGQPGQASSTVLTFSDNANTPNGNGGTLGTTGGASTNLSSSNVSVENITFANSTPLGGSQAVALLVSGDQVQFRNCRFMSYQDTLYVRKAKQYFRDCYVQGSVDYIFGDGTTVFENCTVHSASGGVAVTAPNTAQTVAYGLVFLGGELTAAASVAARSVTLGRNWGAYGAAAYIGTRLGAHIKPVGWMAMGTNTLDTARFSEYQTSGVGATPSAIAARAPQSTQLSAAEAADYDLASIFGSWTPSFSQ